ncbi:MAG: pyridoxal-5-phosphate-dependent protein subunit beta, partial [bacterium]
MINLKLNKTQLNNTIKCAQDRNIVIPTFEQMIHPEQIPGKIKDQLKGISLWEVNPLNLFRITWKNEPKAEGGSFGGVNFLEIPKALTGVNARIFGLVGKWFPTGAHKVGAS